MGIAEKQLRVMLLKLEATDAELAGALVQTALPPAPEVEPQNRRRPVGGDVGNEG